MKRTRDSGRHVDLFGAGCETVDRSGERSILGENVNDVLHAGHLKTARNLARATAPGARGCRS